MPKRDINKKRKLTVRRTSAFTVGAVALALYMCGDAVSAAQQGTTSDQYAFHLRGTVVQVTDGDSFTLSVNHRHQKIRMASIDAPELGDASRPGQPFARQSREALINLIAGKTLTLNCFERDRYERSVCDVPLSGPGTANQIQVQQGMAWANTEGRGKFLRDEALLKYQKQAQRARLGLWKARDPEPIAPWVWRYQCWKQQQC